MEFVMFITPEIIGLVEECNSGRPGRRTSKRKKIRRPAVPQLDPAVKKQVTELTRRLGTASPELRAWLLDDIRQKFTPNQVVILVDSVLYALLRTQSNANFEGLAHTLIGFGTTSLNALSLATWKARTARHQSVLAALLERMVPSMTAEQRTELALHMQIVLSKWTDAKAIEAAIRVLTAV
jgi:hypothetical protein